MKPLPGIVLVAFLFLVPVLACGQDKSEEPADFPPGVFSSGQKYHLADFKGKVVVLLFFDATGPVAGLPGPVMTQITDPVRKYRGEPFKFIVVASGARPAAAAAFARGLGLNLTVFSDSLALLEKRLRADRCRQEVRAFYRDQPDRQRSGQRHDCREHRRQQLYVLQGRRRANPEQAERRVEV